MANHDSVVGASDARNPYDVGSNPGGSTPFVAFSLQRNEKDGDNKNYLLDLKDVKNNLLQIRTPRNTLSRGFSCSKSPADLEKRHNNL